MFYTDERHANDSKGTSVFLFRHTGSGFPCRGRLEMFLKLNRVVCLLESMIYLLRMLVIVSNALACIVQT